MTELASWKETFKPLRIPAIAVVILGMVSFQLFESAQNIPLPYDPESLTTVDLQVDQVTSCQGSTYLRGQVERFAVPCLFSNDYPGVQFMLQSAATSIPFTPHERVELMVHRNPSALAGQQNGQTFSVNIPVRVYGVRKAGKLLADPGPIYKDTRASKTWRELLAWAALILALGAAIFTFRKARKILRDDRW